MESIHFLFGPIVILFTFCCFLGFAFFYLSSFVVKNINNKDPKEVWKFIKGLLIPERTKIYGRVISLTDSEGKILAKNDEELKKVINSITLVPVYYIEIMDVNLGRVVVEIRAFDFIGKLRRRADKYVDGYLDLMFTMNCYKYSSDPYLFLV